MELLLRLLTALDHAVNLFLQSILLGSHGVEAGLQLGPLLLDPLQLALDLFFLKLAKVVGHLFRLELGQLFLERVLLLLDATDAFQGLVLVHQGLPLFLLEFLQHLGLLVQLILDGLLLVDELIKGLRVLGLRVEHVHEDLLLLLFGLSLGLLDGELLLGDDLVLGLDGLGNILVPVIGQGLVLLLQIILGQEGLLEIVSSLEQRAIEVLQLALELGVQPGVFVLQLDDLERRLLQLILYFGLLILDLGHGVPAGLLHGGHLLLQLLELLRQGLLVLLGSGEAVLGLVELLLGSLDGPTRVAKLALASLEVLLHPLCVDLALLLELLKLLLEALQLLGGHPGLLLLPLQLCHGVGDDVLGVRVLLLQLAHGLPALDGGLFELGLHLFHLFFQVLALIFHFCTDLQRQAH